MYVVLYDNQCYKYITIVVSAKNRCLSVNSSPEKRNDFTCVSIASHGEIFMCDAVNVIISEA